MTAVAAVLDRVRAMSVPGRAGLVLGGYAAAFAIALALVVTYSVLAGRVDADASGGMYAFRDAMLFLWLFALAAVLPSCLLLWLLRPYRTLWLALSAAAFALAATGVVALLLYVGSRRGILDDALEAWSALAVVRILVAPVLAPAFLLTATFAPGRTERLVLACVTVSEGAIFAIAATVLLAA
jgi:hypothetical protein